MAKRGKKYREALSKIDRSRLYTPEEAIHLLKEVAYTRFDPTAEVHVRLGVDPRHSDQQVRGVVLLPHGTGKPVRILVFAEGEDARIAEEAGADYVGGDELIEKVASGWLDFDVAIAVQTMMRRIGRLGRILGPRGLMPSPKGGTVVAGEDLPRVIQEARQGRVEFRVDRTANVHVPFGKVRAFSEQQLLENLAAVMDAIVRARPAAAKGTYIRRVAVTPSMGPGIRVDPNLAAALRPA